MPDLPKLPPIATEPLSVVLLAHNPGPALEAVVTRWVRYLTELGRPYEFLLVDDGSTDGSAERAAALAQQHPRLTVLRHPARRGEGAALRTGLAAARYPLLFYTCCDPTYRPDDLARLLARPVAPGGPPEIDQVHVISAYRAGGRMPAGWRAVGVLWRLLCRVLLSYPPEPLPGWLGWKRHAGRLLVRALFGVRYHDVACPFRLIRRDIFARIPIQSDGPFAHVEILAKANFLGHIFAERELPLPSGHHPPLDAPQPPGRVRQILAEGWHVFQHPDFGPPAKPAPPVPSADQPPAGP